MRVVVTGSTGQVGRALASTVPGHIEWIGLNRSTVDLSNPDAIRSAMRALKPDWIVNAAAHTNVESAESEQAAALLVNAQVPQWLAETALDVDARLLQISTDFVFDGNQGIPYATDATMHPLNVYGATKAAGERAVQSVCGPQALIVRTAWVYSAYGRNFVHTIMKAALEQKPLRVIDNQIGSPTWATGLAYALWKIIALDLQGTYHWTDSGIASWYDFAVAIVEEAAAAGLIPEAAPVTPIKSDEFVSKAKRPLFSVLDKTSTCLALTMRPNYWRHNLREMLKELKHGRSPSE